MNEHTEYPHRGSTVGMGRRRVSPLLALLGASTLISNLPESEPLRISAGEADDFIDPDFLKKHGHNPEVIGNYPFTPSRNRFLRLPYVLPAPRIDPNAKQHEREKIEAAQAKRARKAAKKAKQPENAGSFENMALVS